MVSPAYEPSEADPLGASSNVILLPPSKKYASPGTCKMSLIKIRRQSRTLTRDPGFD